MPSATRNTNANNGNDGSAPAKPKTWSNTSAQTPSVAKNDSTTVATSSSGATIARSSSASTRKITTRIAGMITRLSRADSCLMS